MCAANSVRFVSTDNAPASSARNTAGANLAPSESHRDVPECPPSLGFAPAVDRPPSVLSHALAAPAAASAPWPHLRHSSAHCGSRSTIAQMPVHSAQNSKIVPIARDIHSRSSSFRKRLESPTKSTVPSTKPMSTAGGPTVTYAAHDIAYRGSSFHSMKFVTAHVATPMPAAIATTASDRGPNRSCTRWRALPRCVANTSSHAVAHASSVHNMTGPRWLSVTYVRPT